MKIYVITEGDYSDYHICAVTEDKEQANHLRKLFSGRCSYAEIEEYDTEEYSLFKKDEEFYQVSKINGRLEIYQESIEVNDTKDESVDDIIRIVQGIAQRTGIRTYVLAKDENHALKIAADRFAKYEAEKLGI